MQFGYYNRELRYANASASGCFKQTIYMIYKKKKLK